MTRRVRSVLGGIDGRTAAVVRVTGVRAKHLSPSARCSYTAASTLPRHAVTCRLQHHARPQPSEARKFSKLVTRQPSEARKVSESVAPQPSEARKVSKSVAPQPSEARKVSKSVTRQPSEARKVSKSVTPQPSEARKVSKSVASQPSEARKVINVVSVSRHDGRDPHGMGRRETRRNEARSGARGARYSIYWGKRFELGTSIGARA